MHGRCRGAVPGHGTRRSPRWRIRKRLRSWPETAAAPAWASGRAGPPGCRPGACSRWRGAAAARAAHLGLPPEAAASPTTPCWPPGRRDPCHRPRDILGGYLVTGNTALSAQEAHRACITTPLAQLQAHEGPSVDARSRRPRCAVHGASRGAGEARPRSVRSVGTVTASECVARRGAARYSRPPRLASTTGVSPRGRAWQA